MNGQPAFRNPLLIPPVLTGTFAEVRSNHFHSGIDLKTNEAEGLPVLAAADGFVSRIKVSATGFGNALYVHHPSGFTTVYAHLHRFNDELEKIIEEEMMLKKSFEVELFFESGKLRVVSGQLLGFSGNTGGSTGPHLHFEIRDRKTEQPLNPMDFGFVTEDTIPPSIQNIMVIDYRPFGEAFYPIKKTILPVFDPEGEPHLHSDTIAVSETAAFAVQSIDRAGNSNAQLGIKQLLLLHGSDTIFNYSISRFSFSETRYVNASIDYETMVKEGKTFILLHLIPGNRFSAFHSLKNKGFIQLTDGQIKSFEIRVRDEAGNESSKTVWLKKEKSSGMKAAVPENKYISFNKNPQAVLADARIDFPEGLVTYNISDFEFSSSDSVLCRYSKWIKAGSETIPVHTSFKLSIRAVNLPVHLQNKALIVKRNDKGQVSAAGGSFANGWVTATVRSFGHYYIETDTTAPAIVSLGLAYDPLWSGNTLRFRITDDLSGIRKYEMQIDNRWVPARFDAKSGSLIYICSSGNTVSEKEVTVTADDAKGNTAKFTGRFSF